MKNRLEKKVLKIVAGRLGQDQEVPKFYLLKAEKHFDDYQHRKYLNEFRPAWYEAGMPDWKESYIAHLKKINAEYEVAYGVDIKLLVRYSRALKSIEKGKRKSPKRRKTKPAPPIRKLRNPRMYKISMKKGGEPDYCVIGELAFEYRGFEFFIHHFQDMWTVSERQSGLRVARAGRYKQAIADARKLVERNFESLKQQVRGRGA